MLRTVCALCVILTGAAYAASQYGKGVMAAMLADHVDPAIAQAFGISTALALMALVYVILIGLAFHLLARTINTSGLEWPEV